MADKFSKGPVVKTASKIRPIAESVRLPGVYRPLLIKLRIEVRVLILHRLQPDLFRGLAGGVAVHLPPPAGLAEAAPGELLFSGDSARLQPGGRQHDQIRHRLAAGGVKRHAATFLTQNAAPSLC